MQQWYNVALQIEQAEKLNAYLKEHGIYFEPSYCYNLVHFEMKLDESEYKMINSFLENL